MLLVSSQLLRSLPRMGKSRVVLESHLLLAENLLERMCHSIQGIVPPSWSSKKKKLRKNEGWQKIEKRSRRSLKRSRIKLRERGKELISKRSWREEARNRECRKRMITSNLRTNHFLARDYEIPRVTFPGKGYRRTSLDRLSPKTSSLVAFLNLATARCRISKWAPKCKPLKTLSRNRA